MADVEVPVFPMTHSHVFLGQGHAHAERRTWAVIWLCGVMMALEIVGGWLFGSIALVADGLHMSTHAGAMLLAALAYHYARRHADDPRFTFGTGKLGDLAGFTSAIILAMIAVLIGYEAVSRFVAPVPIHFAEAIPIACLGLAVNVASAWLLSGGHHHHHGHGHGHADGHDDAHRIPTSEGVLVLSVFEDNHPPVFRLHAETGTMPAAVSIETVRPDGARQVFAMADRGGYLESLDEIPEPHAFTAHVRAGGGDCAVVFQEHEHAHGAAHRDNNMRAAVIHVAADAAVSVLVIAGLLLARAFGWLWMDPLAGTIGACVIASWSYGLIRDTGAILLDMNPDQRMTRAVQSAIEADGDRLGELHVWRLGPGHLGAILSVMTQSEHDARFYRGRLARFRALSHVTIEIDRMA
ncbi:cation transporter [Rhodopila globiformis]|uniref:Cation transporter n=2 Tax=Rhodopila globiformis TaxID=1071 RepID=A0A2S6N1I4_RHOGL|nr:cation transporter [Rhodopila globiformis]